MQECLSKIAKMWNEYCGDCLFDENDIVRMIAIAQAMLDKSDITLTIRIEGPHDK